MIRPQDPGHGGQAPIDPKALFLHMERSLRKVPPDDIGESQACYYDAMEARSEIGAYHLLSRALELDPGNSDAWLLMLSHYPSQSADEVIETLRKIVTGAEERLGKQAFKAFAGHFWGFHEARP